MQGPIRIAIDIGGTFTDLEIFDARSGAIHEVKTPSTPADPSIGLMAGIRQAMVLVGFDVEDIGHVLHGTTIATNAVLERKLPRGAVITTAGFEDVLTIGRHGRREVYALNATPVKPLVRRKFLLGVRERVRADGTIETPLVQEDVRLVIDTLKSENIAAVAVCLLHAYAHPAHEQEIGAMIAAAAPEIAVSLSSEISPEIREYERLSTTVLNALLMPIVAGYMSQLRDRLAGDDIKARVYLVQSNGGVAALDRAAREPARLLLSGPSGGAAAAQLLAADLAMPDLVAVDMGGTSFDVSVIHGGRAAMVNEGDVDGWPVRLPMVEMRTIGAGGGSIVWVDAGGRLRIGPHSAGAVPGPACYGHGGTDLTVTDANLLLGRIDPAAFLGGEMKLDAAAAGAAAERVAAALGLNVAATAEGVVAVTNSNLATAMRLSLFEKGLDPEDFAVLSFGGAGGLHACEVAAELGITRVVFPAHASTLSAWGILWSDIVHDFTASVIGTLLQAGSALAARAERLAGQARTLLDEDGVAMEDRTLHWTLDCRYVGQAFELPVQLGLADFSPGGLAKVETDFHTIHQQLFSYHEPDGVVEIVALRLAARGRLASPVASASAAIAKQPPAAATRSVLHGGQAVPAVVRPRQNLAVGEVIAGPAIIEEAYTSAYVPPGWQIHLHRTGAMIAERSRL
jgi:N-methylhydantoinase A